MTDAGRLGVYTLMGGATGLVPLPWVPEILAARVRGAVVQDLAARHGVSVSRKARKVLASSAPSMSLTKGAIKGAVVTTATYVAKRVLSRVGPMIAVSPMKTGLEIFVLGHLFSRYLEQRPAHAGRKVEEDEAKRIRGAIDHALREALRSQAPPPEWLPGPVDDDDRDRTTAAIDSVVMRMASVPSWVVGRVDAAFDDLMARAGTL